MKKLLKIGIICFVVAMLGYLGYKIINKINYKSEVKERLQTVPTFAFQEVKSGMIYTKNDLPPKRTAIFVYFSSDCDFCQHETQSIWEHITELQETTVLFISREPISTIKEFAKKYNLADFENVHFLYDEKDTFYLQFDANSIPYMLVYNTNRELILRNKGQLNIKTVLKKIEENK